MSSFLKNVWDVVGSEMTGLLGNEQERQDKVTGLLIDKPFEFGKDIGFYGDKIEAPEVIDTTNVNNSVKDNAIASLTDQFSNMQQDSQTFVKNLPANLFELGEFGIDLAMNPLKYGKEAIDLGSGFATMPFENIDNLDNETMAQSVIDSTIEFFGTEGAIRKAALENPAEVLFIMMGGASGIKKLQALKPETKERMLSVIQRVGATPVGLSMKDVSNTNLSKVEGNTDLTSDGRQLAPVDESGFYSKAQQTVLDSMPKDLPQEQLRGWFEKRGVSQTELGDLGILAMIDDMGRGDKITKEGLLEHIADQDLTFKTTVLGGDKSEYDDNFGEDRYVSDEQNFEISDASAQFRSRYEAINMSNYSGLSNWSRVFDSIDEPDNWLEIQGSGWSLSPDSETRAYEFGKDIFADEIGSYDQTSPSVDGEMRRLLQGDRNKYPFNNIAHIKKQEGEPYEEGFNTDFRDHMDESNLQFTVYMNKINPERYPETKSMELKSLYMELNKRKSTEGETRINPELQGLMLDATSPQSTILEKIALLEADIMDDVRTGNIEWDMKMLEGANGVNDVYDMVGFDQRFKSDMEEAQEMMGRDLYLNDPEFEFDIEVGGEQYKAYGNEGIGYFVGTPDEGLQHGLSDFDDIYDIPALETAIREHAMERGYIDEFFDGDGDGGDYGDTKWEQFTLNRQHTEAPRENYKENIIQINPDKEQLQGAYQYENDVHYRGVKGLFAHVRSSDRREFGTDTNMVKFIEELQSDFQQSRRQFGATKAETDQLKYLNRMESSAVGDMISVWDNLNKGLGDSGEERLINSNATAFDGTSLWKGLTKTREQKELYKEAMLAQSDDYLFANFSSTSPDRKKQAREGIKEWDATWGDNPKNPDSPNWEGISYDEYTELGQYISSHGDALRLTGTRLDSHVHTTRAPIQGDKWYTTALNHEIMKAVEDGKTTLAWANSDQILDQWNPARQTDYKKKIKNQENYVNTYDKKITNAAKKMAKKYGGEFEVIKVDLGNGKFSENFSIRITPLMIENMKKEFPANNKSGFARPTHGKLQDIPTGLLKTDITEQQGLLA